MPQLFRPLLIASMSLAALTVPAQEKKPEKKDVPRVAVCIPLGIPAGTPTKITIRGQKLDSVTEIRFFDPNVTAKILKKDKSPPPAKQEPTIVGDTMLEAEIVLPAGMSPADGYFVVVTPGGESAPHRLLLNGKIPVIPEKEPNNGFRQAQAVQVPQAIDGAISQPQDVDVFKFEGKAGQKIVCEVLAARHGSALDSLLTLYTSSGKIVASNDDHGGSTDSRIEVTLPEAGTYYLSLSDAHDQGGPAHVYRLVIR
jgi:Bacterial pre-peptidase C-terminal domain